MSGLGGRRRAMWISGVGCAVVGSAANLLGKAFQI